MDETMKGRIRLTISAAQARIAEIVALQASPTTCKDDRLLLQGEKSRLTARAENFKRLLDGDF